jgi:hypothetical protein
MQSRRFITLWLGLALGAGISVGAAEARTNFETLYLADFVVLEPQGGCVGPGTRLLESTLMATGVPMNFDSYLKDNAEFCEMTIRRGGEAVDVQVDCETSQPVPPEAAREPEAVVTQAVELRARLRLCVGPTEIQAELIGPVELAMRPGAPPFRIARDLVDFGVEVPGRDGSAESRLPPDVRKADGAYVWLGLHCLPGGQDEATGRDLFAGYTLLRFKIIESLPDECVEGRCQIPFASTYFGYVGPSGPHCSQPGVEP